LLQRLGRFAEAERYLREALAKNRRTLGDTHPYTLTMTRILADMLRHQDKSADAVAVLRPVLETLRREKGEDDPEPVAQLGYFGGALRDAGKLDEAEICLGKALDANRRRFGDEHANTLTAILRMGSLRVAQRKYAEALSLLAPIEGKIRKIIPGMMGMLRDASLKGLLGKARMGLAKEPAEFKLPEANLLEAQSVFAKNRGDKDIETREWVRGLADLYAAWDKAEPGKGYDAKAALWKAKLPKEAAPALPEK
jgi:tetratricopeptide (TPR) repeat protein